MEEYGPTIYKFTHPNETKVAQWLLPQQETQWTKSQYPEPSDDSEKVKTRKYLLLEERAA